MFKMYLFDKKKKQCKSILTKVKLSIFIFQFEYWESYILKSYKVMLIVTKRKRKELNYFLLLVRF